jgi:hypothetical protein
MLNNIWGGIIIIILLFFIYRNIININKPCDEKIIIKKYRNQMKLKKEIKFNNIIELAPDITSYYVGIL